VSPRTEAPGRERGAVLFIAMLLLVSITLLALAATRGSLLQERMTGAQRDRQLAQFGAQSALRGAEEWLWQHWTAGGGPLPECSGASGMACVYRTRGTSPHPLVHRFRSATGWLDPSQDGAQAYARPLDRLPPTLLSARLAAQPRFLVEELGVDERPGPDGATQRRVLYRITARSPGGRLQTVEVLESMWSMSVPVAAGGGVRP
jgi:type IV pilus assembly protein PilX